MNSPNPYETTDRATAAPVPKRRLSRLVGAIVLAVGLIVLAYGVTAFWLLTSLPPNGGAYGRLPSLYLMLGGIVTTLIGLATRPSAGRPANYDSSSGAFPSIRSRYGLLLILLIIIILFGVVSRL